MTKKPHLADMPTRQRALEDGGFSVLTLIADTHYTAAVKFDATNGQTVALPQLVLQVSPGADLPDWGHPVTGLPGLHAAPPEGLALNLWADDLLTVTNAEHWRIVLDATDPFEPAWLNIVSPGPGADFRPAYGVLTITFDPFPVGRPFALDDAEIAALPSSFIRLIDHRGEQN